jgi:hypothetical protein
MALRFVRVNQQLLFVAVGIIGGYVLFGSKGAFFGAIIGFILGLKRWRF